LNDVTLCTIAAIRIGHKSNISENIVHVQTEYQGLKICIKSRASRTLNTWS